MTDSNKEEIITRQLFDAHPNLKDLKEIRMANVFDNNWRVDIWCYYHDPDLMDSFSRPANIKYSYFINVDDAAKILDSSPELGR